MAQITRRNFLEAAGAAGLLGALAACDTKPAEEPQGEGSATKPEPEQTEPEPEEPEEPEGPQPHDLSEYPLDPDGDDVEALWSEEALGDGWTRVTQEAGGKTLGYIPGGCDIIQVDGYAFKDLNKNGKLDAYEDWRLPVEDRAAQLASELTAEEILPLMFNNGFMSSSVPLDDTATSQLAAGMRGGVTRSSPSTNNYIDFVKWINAVQEWCEANDKYGIPYICDTDPYGVLPFPDLLGLAPSMDVEIAAKAGELASKIWRACGITCLLGPQIDLATVPTWNRFSGTIAEDPRLNRDFAAAYINGMQSTYDEDGNDLGWGEDSMLGMMKHFCGAGAAEGGRNDHSDNGKYCTFPGDNFEAHLIPFFDGAMNLEGKTGMVASAMPNYGIAFSADEEYGENVGGGFSEFKLGLLRDNGFDNMIVTDWGITVGSGGTRCWGVEDLTSAQRMAKGMMAGDDAFGGEFSIETITEAYGIIEDELGADGALELVQNSARRIFTAMMRVDLFDEPYSSRDKCKAIFDSEEVATWCQEATDKCVVMLKNAGDIIRKREGDDKPTVYLPMKYSAGSSGFSFMGITIPASDPGWSMPISEEVANEYFNVVTDTATGTGENDIIRASADEIAKCDFTYYSLSAASTVDGYDDETQTYTPISLQYREYTADGPNVRKQSIAGNKSADDPTPAYGDTYETRENRSYFGKSITCSNESQLDNLIAFKESLPEGLPIVLTVNLAMPMCFHEVEPLVDAILVSVQGFGGGSYTDSYMRIMAGQLEPQGMLSFQLPKDMDAVEASNEDCPRDMDCYEDSEGNVYDFAFGLGWDGPINDDRYETYSQEPLTKVETIDF